MEEKTFKPNIDICINKCNCRTFHRYKKNQKKDRWLLACLVDEKLSGTLHCYLRRIKNNNKDKFVKRSQLFDVPTCCPFFLEQTLSTEKF